MGAIGLIVLGSFVAIVSCFGCIGASRESRCRLCMYFVVLGLILAAMIAVGAIAITQRSKFDEGLQTAWVDLTDSEKKAIQDQFNCCGWANPSDHPATPCPQDQNVVGCESQVENFIDNRLKIVGITGITIACIQVIGI